MQPMPVQQQMMAPPPMPAQQTMQVYQQHPQQQQGGYAGHQMGPHGEAMHVGNHAPNPNIGLSGRNEYKDQDATYVVFVS